MKFQDVCGNGAFILVAFGLFIFSVK